MNTAIRLLALILLATFAMGARCTPPPFPTVDGDVDDDAWVTAADKAIVQGCLGQDPATVPACAASDVERDGDVDIFDLAKVNQQVGHMVCNRAPQLCDRRVDEVAYPTNHNAFTSVEDGWFLPNQEFAIPTQLSDGIRGLMLDTHYYTSPSFPNDSVFLCHGVGFCQLGHQSLIAELTRIKDYLDTHLGEVVTLIFESYVSAADTADVFEEAGLLDPISPGTDYLYVHGGGAWPKLSDLVLSGERLIVLTDDNLSASEQAQFPWYHYLWNSLAFETPFSLHPDDFPVPGFVCDVNRGNGSNDLMILNHFLTNQVGHQSYADMVNHNPFFLQRAEQCEIERTHIPNFVTVDFHDIGDVFDVVRSLNGL